jgi:hypothetical protein
MLEIHSVKNETYGPNVISRAPTMQTNFVFGCNSAELFGTARRGSAVVAVARTFNHRPTSKKMPFRIV